MELEELYEQAIKYKEEQEKILKEKENDFEKAESNLRFQEINGLLEEVFKKIHEIENSEILKNSFLFIH